MNSEDYEVFIAWCEDGIKETCERIARCKRRIKGSWYFYSIGLVISVLLCWVCWPVKAFTFWMWVLNVVLNAWGLLYWPRRWRALAHEAEWLLAALIFARDDLKARLKSERGF